MGLGGTIATSSTSGATLHRFENARGATILGLHCRAVGPARGTVLLPSSYGKRILHNAVVSECLNRHGYDTFRFDLTNHVGLSDGVIQDFSMSSMVDDIDAASSYCAHQYQNVAMLAFSLSARAAIRVWATRGYRNRLVLGLPAVNVRSTLLAVTGIDVFSPSQWDEVSASTTGTIEVLGYQVRWEFGPDAVDHKLTDLADAVADLELIDAPATALIGGADEWVDPSEVGVAFKPHPSAPRKIVVIDDVSHDLAHNPPALRLVLETLLSSIDPTLDHVEHLNFEEMVSVARRERRWARKHYQELEVGP